MRAPREDWWGVRARQEGEASFLWVSVEEDKRRVSRVVSEEEGIHGGWTWRRIGAWGESWGAINSGGECPVPKDRQIGGRTFHNQHRSVAVGEGSQSAPRQLGASQGDGIHGGGMKPHQ